MKSIKIAIADNHKSVRDTFAYFLTKEHGIKIPIKAENGKTLLAALKKNNVDIAIIDLEMPVLNGKETCKLIMENFPNIKIIVWTFHNEKGRLIEMLNVGAVGFVSKECGVAEVLKAIKIVLNGGIFVSKEMKNSKLLFKIPKAEGNNILNNEFGITVKENRVLNLLQAGESAKEIANKMGIKYRTVESHKRNLFRKTGVHSVVKLVAFAKTHNII